MRFDVLREKCTVFGNQIGTCKKVSPKTELLLFCLHTCELKNCEISIQEIATAFTHHPGKKKKDDRGRETVYKAFSCRV